MSDSHLFEKAPMREYKRRSFWGRLRRRPATITVLVTAALFATVVLGLGGYRLLDGRNHAATAGSVSVTP